MRPKSRNPDNATVPPTIKPKPLSNRFLRFCTVAITRYTAKIAVRLTETAEGNREKISETKISNNTMTLDVRPIKKALEKLLREGTAILRM